jgi:TRAP-type mannitol/chloroaromatic compound transport system substrate-binding protein
MPSGTSPHVSIERVAGEITAASGGRLVLNPFSGGGVVPAFEEFDGIDAGTIQAGHNGGFQRSHVIPYAGLFCSVVGGMQPVDFYSWLVNGGGYELNQKSLEQFNVVALKGCGWLEAPEVFFHTKNPINSVADIEGLKFRTAGDGGAILDMMGAKTVLIPGGEIYDAMVRGVIDACEAAGPNINWSLAFQEIAPQMYLSSARSPGLYGDFLINKSAWEELPPDLKQLVESVLRSETMRFYSEAVWQDSAALQKFKDYGVEIYKVPSDIEDELRKQAKIYYDEMGTKFTPVPEILQSQREFQSIWEGYVQMW